MEALALWDKANKKGEVGSKVTWEWGAAHQGLGAGESKRPGPRTYRSKTR